MAEARRFRDARDERSISAALRDAIHRSDVALASIAIQAGLTPIQLDEFLTGERTLRSDIQAEENLKKTRAILALHASMSEQLADLTRSQHASRALAWMFTKPVFQSSDFVKSAKIPTPTAHRFLAVLREAAVLKTVKPARGTQAAVFAFPALVNIVEGRKVF